MLSEPLTAVAGKPHSILDEQVKRHAYGSQFGTLTKPQEFGRSKSSISWCGVDPYPHVDSATACPCTILKEAEEKRREAGLCGTHLDDGHEKNHFVGNRTFCHILPYLSIFDHISRYFLGEAMSKRYSLWILRRWMMIPRHSIGHDWFPSPKNGMMETFTGHFQDLGKNTMVSECFR